MSYSEILCEKSLRLIFEDGVEIVRNYRPDWLKNPKSKRNLELDFYLPHMPLAIEIQGQHHYDDAEQICRDKIKRQILINKKIPFIELSIFQIDPARLRDKILSYSHLSQYQSKIKSYDPRWNTLTDIKEYKQKILECYNNSDCILSPYTNRVKEMKKKKIKILDEKIMSVIEFGHKMGTSIVRVTPLEIVSSDSVKCRILGCDKIIFVKKKKLIDI